MYPVGLLFGLGFDTATEIALLATAGAAAAGGLPIYAILCLPILFAAGMSLLDTIDGAFMNFAYGWAFSKPVRKIFYNITITSLSVVVALRDRHDRADLGARREAQPDAASRGTSSPASTSTTSATRSSRCSSSPGSIALAVWRFGRIEERWSAGMRPAGAVIARAGPAAVCDDRVHPARPDPVEFERNRRGPRRSCGSRAIGSRRPAGWCSRRCSPPTGRSRPQFIADGLGRTGVEPGAALRVSKPRAARGARRRPARPPRSRPGPLHAGRRRRQGVPRVRALRAGDQPRARRARRGPPPDPQALRVRGSLRPLPDHRSVRASAPPRRTPTRSTTATDHEHSHGDYVHSHPHVHAGDGGTHTGTEAAPRTSPTWGRRYGPGGEPPGVAEPG